jgi:hypothetical protein
LIPFGVIAASASGHDTRSRALVALAAIRLVAQANVLARSGLILSAPTNLRAIAQSIRV